MNVLLAHRCSFSPKWQHSSQETDQQASDTLHQSEKFYNTHAHPLTDIEVVSTVAMQNQQTKHWDIYGKVVAIGPYRKYHIRTQSGQVLVRNRRFLRHRSASCVPKAPSQQNLPTNLPSQPAIHAPPRRHLFNPHISSVAQNDPTEHLYI